MPAAKAISLFTVRLTAFCISLCLSIIGSSLIFMALVCPGFIWFLVCGYELIGLLVMFIVGCLGAVIWALGLWILIAGTLRLDER
ncbi:MAG: hypothetical protein J0H83_16285 [Candidatus Melainabacteria bacterium]|nr:hypothetical protein [Candidatus Melainabacteria bacterium]